MSLFCVLLREKKNHRFSLLLSLSVCVGFFGGEFSFHPKYLCGINHKLSLVERYWAILDGVWRMHHINYGSLVDISLAVRHR